MAAPVCVADEYISLIDVAPLEKPAFLVSTSSFVRFRFLRYESVSDTEWVSDTIRGRVLLIIKNGVKERFC